jgi:beta-N-acetylhexosaminidase
VNRLSHGVFEPLNRRRMQRIKGSIAPILVVSIILVAIVTAVFSTPPEETWTEKTLKSLSLRQKIAQLVQIRVPGKFTNHNSPEFLKIAEQIRRDQVGGLVLFAGNVYESAILLNELQSISRLPLLVASDFERGASFRIEDTTSFPWTMALGATGSEQLAYQQGLVTAQESRALGVHWIYAPVVDVNNNPDNPVINIRSFGEDPELVARLGAAFIRGAKKGSVLTTAKHFPGHGDTATDSHIGLPVVESDMARLQSIEFVPFRRAIAEGVDSIMTAHVAVPRITGESKTPATLSARILTDTLRDMLQFQGLIVTDALEMAGVANQYWCGLAAIRAIQAGADVLLLPPDAAVAINEVERAVKRGEISQARIDASVRKILDAKSRLRLQRNRLVAISQIGETIASPHNLELAQEIADRSVTVVKDEAQLLPINSLVDTHIFSLVLASDLESSPGAVFQKEMRRRFPSVRTAWANARIPEDLSETIDAEVDRADLIVCSTLVRLTSGQNAVSIPQNQLSILRKLLDTHKPVIWIAFGNPYVLRLVPQIGTYLCTFSYSDTSQIAAAKALSGEIAITGKLPISIPEYGKMGEGLQIPRFEMTLKSALPETLGLPQNAFVDTHTLLTDLIGTGAIPGAEFMVGYDGKIILEVNAGKTGNADNSTQVSPNTVYDLTSISRPVAATMATALAMESKDLSLASLIKEYVPEVSGTKNERLHIQDLLVAISKRENAENENQNAAQLEKVLSRSAGIPWHQFLTEQLLAPLGMMHTSRNVPLKHHAVVADSGTSESLHLFSTARDLGIFAQMLLNRGIYDHRRYSSPETLMRLLGSKGPWMQPSEADWTGRLFSASSFGHSAANGSFIWIDPGKKLFLILLTSGQQGDSKILDTQRMLAESAILALSK